MPKRIRTERAPPELPDASVLMPIVSEAIRVFNGQGPELESAIGMLFVGHAYGWKVIHIIHSPATVRKYEAILNIKIKDVFPEKTSYSERSVGFKIVDGLSNFWKAVKGEIGGKEARSREFSS